MPFEEDFIETAYDVGETRMPLLTLGKEITLISILALVQSIGPKTLETEATQQLDI